MSEQNRNLIKLFMGELSCVELNKRPSAEDTLQVMSLVGSMYQSPLFRSVLNNIRSNSCSLKVTRGTSYDSFVILKDENGTLVSQTVN